MVDKIALQTIMINLMDSIIFRNLITVALSQIRVSLRYFFIKITKQIKTKQVNFPISSASSITECQPKQSFVNFKKF